MPQLRISSKIATFNALMLIAFSLPEPAAHDIPPGAEGAGERGALLFFEQFREQQATERAPRAVGLHGGAEGLRVEELGAVVHVVREGGEAGGAERAEVSEVVDAYGSRGGRIARG